MNRKLTVSLFLVVNATIALNLLQNHLHRQPAAISIADDRAQPPAPPPGRKAASLPADGTQPPAPPPGRSATILMADGTQPPAPPPGRTAFRTFEVMRDPTV
jgi:hypothetical protein